MGVGQNSSRLISVERALRYDLWYETPLGRGALSREREELVRLLPKYYNVVLEVGCGTGRFLQILGEGARALCVGLDRSPSMLKVASWRVKGCRLVAGDALRLPFGADSFDVVAMLFVLEFLTDPLRGMLEALRVAREVVVFGGINPRSLWGLRYWLRRELARRGIIKSSFASAFLRPPSKIRALLLRALKISGVKARLKCRSGLVLPPLSPFWSLPVARAVDGLLSASLRPLGGFYLFSCEILDKGGSKGWKRQG